MPGMQALKFLSLCKILFYMYYLLESNKYNLSLHVMNFELHEVFKCKIRRQFESICCHVLILLKASEFQLQTP